MVRKSNCDCKKVFYALRKDGTKRKRCFECQDIYNKNQYWITLNWPYKIRLFKIDKNDFTTINQIETIIYYFIIFLLVVGFISYGGEIRDTLKKSKHLSWIDVITDTDICRLKDRKSFFHYLKVGIGVSFNRIRTQNTIL